MPTAHVLKAVRVALADYLRTSLRANGYSSLDVVDDWPAARDLKGQSVSVITPGTPEVRAFPPKAFSTTLTSGTTANIVYAIGQVTAPIQVDSWNRYQEDRDLIAPKIESALNQPPSITLLGASNDYPSASGLTIPVPLLYNYPATYTLKMVPNVGVTQAQAPVGEFRAIYSGTVDVWLLKDYDDYQMQTIIAVINGTAVTLQP